MVRLQQVRDIMYVIPDLFIFYFSDVFQLCTVRSISSKIVQFFVND